MLSCWPQEMERRRKAGVRTEEQHKVFEVNWGGLAVWSRTHFKSRFRVTGLPVGGMPWWSSCLSCVMPWVQSPAHLPQRKYTWIFLSLLLGVGSLWICFRICKMEIKLFLTLAIRLTGDNICKSSRLTTWSITGTFDVLGCPSPLQFFLSLLRETWPQWRKHFWLVGEMKNWVG